MQDNPSPTLKRSLRITHLWSLAVGLVISGSYFGWNYGWDVAGPVGFLVATLLVTIFYIGFIFAFTELNSLIPDAGGPFAFGKAAFGKWGGCLSGYATLVEFVFAPPAIAFALGSYLNFLNPVFPVLPIAIGSFVVFTAINCIGIKESARFNLWVTILAVVELLAFIGIAAPSFEMSRFVANDPGFTWAGVFAALPFAIWFYLGIEGVAMVSEEVIEPKRTIPRGYFWGLLTLVLLTFGIMFMAGGAADWQTLRKIDYPLPEAMSQILGGNSKWSRLFAGLGLFGLIASFHSLIIGYARQIFALSRAGILPASLQKLNRRYQTPNRALLVGSIIGIVCLLTGKTSDIIILSAFGAVAMYTISMLSLFRLRKKSEHPAHFQTPGYPVVPFLTLILALLCLIALIVFNPMHGLIFLGGGVVWVGYLLIRKTP